MKETGKKLKEIRLKKGWSQEELAERAKVNLRTIQRIENNENSPSGKTVRLICEALEINVEYFFEYGKHQDRTFLVLFHLSVLVFIILPLGNIIVPLILWLTNKDKIVGLEKIGANLLNFQILWSVLYFAVMIIGVLGKLSHTSFSLFLYSVVIIFILNIIMPIVFAIKTYNGNTAPLYIKFNYLKIIRN